MTELPPSYDRDTTEEDSLIQSAQRLYDCTQEEAVEIVRVFREVGSAAFAEDLRERGIDTRRPNAWRRLFSQLRLVGPPKTNNHNDS